MESRHYFHNCSKNRLNEDYQKLYSEINSILENINVKETQSEINKKLFWLFIDNNWSFDSLISGLDNNPSFDMETKLDKYEAKQINQRHLCLTSEKTNIDWYCDFAKKFSGKLVHLEVQFGKVEAMFKDFCGFDIAHSENRIDLGIEIVINNPKNFFNHRKKSVSGMAYFDVAKNTLPVMGIKSPIWLIGLKR